MRELEIVFKVNPLGGPRRQYTHASKRYTRLQGGANHTDPSSQPGRPRVEWSSLFAMRGFAWRRGEVLRILRCSGCSMIFPLRGTVAVPFRRLRGA